MLAAMTTATTAATTAKQVRFTYVDDPSGLELRRALLLPPPTDRPVDPAALVLAAVSTLTLLAGLLRVVLA